MSDLVGNPNCFFFHAMAHIRMNRLTDDWTNGRCEIQYGGVSMKMISIEFIFDT